MGGSCNSVGSNSRDEEGSGLVFFCSVYCSSECACRTRTAQSQSKWDSRVVAIGSDRNELAHEQRSIADCERLRAC